MKHNLCHIALLLAFLISGSLSQAHADNRASFAPETFKVYGLTEYPFIVHGHHFQWAKDVMMPEPQFMGCLDCDELPFAPVNLQILMQKEIPTAITVNPRTYDINKLKVTYRFFPLRLPHVKL